jgi:hypothetical protein
MAVFAIPNPKKTIQVDFPIEKIKNSIKNIPLMNKNYKFNSSNDIFNQYTFESYEFLSMGVFLDFHLNSINENKTEINLEIRRKMGSFNQPAEITNANNHIDKLFKYIAHLTTLTDTEIDALIEKNNTPPPPKIKKKNGCLKIGLIVIAVFFGLGIIGTILSPNEKKSTENAVPENKSNLNDLDGISKQLDNELKSFEKPFKRGNIGYKGMINMFRGYNEIIINAKKLNNKDLNEKADKLYEKALKLQKQELPSMRKEFSDEISQKLWEHNVDVKCFGKNNTTIEFIGGLFANNKNIKDSQEKISETLNVLKFKRANYKWIKHDDEYTYYDLDNDENLLIE